MLVIFTLLSFVVGAIALAAFAVAVYSAFRVLMMIPAEKRLRAMLTTTWWQYDRINELCGPAAHPLVHRYIKAVMVFLLCVIVLIVLGILTGSSGVNAANSANRVSLGLLDDATAHSASTGTGSVSISLPLRQES